LLDIPPVFRLIYWPGTEVPESATFREDGGSIAGAMEVQSRQVISLIPESPRQCQNWI
jgi:hypothetical protein